MNKQVGCKYCSNLAYSDIGYVCTKTNKVIWDIPDIKMPHMCMCSEKYFSSNATPISDLLMYKYKYNKEHTDVNLLESRVSYYKSIIDKYEGINHPSTILLIFSCILNVILLICVL